MQVTNPPVITPEFISEYHHLTTAEIRQFIKHLLKDRTDLDEGWAQCKEFANDDRQAFNIFLSVMGGFFQIPSALNDWLFARLKNKKNFSPKKLFKKSILFTYFEFLASEGFIQPSASVNYDNGFALFSEPILRWAIEHRETHEEMSGQAFWVAVSSMTRAEIIRNTDLIESYHNPDCIDDFPQQVLTGAYYYASKEIGSDKFIDKGPKENVAFFLKLMKELETLSSRLHDLNIKDEQTLFEQAKDAQEYLHITTNWIDSFLGYYLEKNTEDQEVKAEKIKRVTTALEYFLDNISELPVSIKDYKAWPLIEEIRDGNIEIDDNYLSHIYAIKSDVNNFIQLIKNLPPKKASLLKAVDKIHKTDCIFHILNGDELPVFDPLGWIEEKYKSREIEQQKQKEIADLNRKSKEKKSQQDKKLPPKKSAPQAIKKMPSDDVLELLKKGQVDIAFALSSLDPQKNISEDQKTFTLIAMHSLAMQGKGGESGQVFQNLDIESLKSHAWFQEHPLLLSIFLKPFLFDWTQSGQLVFETLTESWDKDVAKIALAVMDYKNQNGQISIEEIKNWYNPDQKTSYDLLLEWKEEVQGSRISYSPAHDILQYFATSHPMVDEISNDLLNKELSDDSIAFLHQCKKDPDYIVTQIDRILRPTYKGESIQASALQKIRARISDFCSICEKTDAFSENSQPAPLFLSLIKESEELQALSGIQQFLQPVSIDWWQQKSIKQILSATLAKLPCPVQNISEYKETSIKTIISHLQEPLEENIDSHISSDRFTNILALHHLFNDSITIEKEEAINLAWGKYKTSKARSLIASHKQEQTYSFDNFRHARALQNSFDVFVYSVDDLSQVSLAKLIEAEKYQLPKVPNIKEQPATSWISHHANFFELVQTPNFWQNLYQGAVADPRFFQNNRLIPVWLGIFNQQEKALSAAISQLGFSPDGYILNNGYIHIQPGQEVPHPRFADNKEPVAVFATEPGSPLLPDESIKGKSLLIFYNGAIDAKTRTKYDRIMSEYDACIWLIDSVSWLWIITQESKSNETKWAAFPELYLDGKIHSMQASNIRSLITRINNKHQIAFGLISNQISSNDVAINFAGNNTDQNQIKVITITPDLQQEQNKEHSLLTAFIKSVNELDVFPSPPLNLTEVILYLENWLEGNAGKYLFIIDHGQRFNNEESSVFWESFSRLTEVYTNFKILHKAEQSLTGLTPEIDITCYGILDKISSQDSIFQQIQYTTGLTSIGTRITTLYAIKALSHLLYPQSPVPNQDIDLWGQVLQKTMSMDYTLQSITYPIQAIHLAALYYSENDLPLETEGNLRKPEDLYRLVDSIFPSLYKGPKGLSLFSQDFLEIEEMDLIDRDKSGYCMDIYPCISTIRNNPQLDDAISTLIKNTEQIVNPAEKHIFFGDNILSPFSLAQEKELRDAPDGKPVVIAAAPYTGSNVVEARLSYLLDKETYSFYSWDEYHKKKQKKHTGKVFVLMQPDDLVAYLSFDQNVEEYIWAATGTINQSIIHDAWKKYLSLHPDADIDPNCLNGHYTEISALYNGTFPAQYSLEYNPVIQKGIDLIADYEGDKDAMIFAIADKMQISKKKAAAFIWAVQGFGII